MPLVYHEWINPDLELGLWNISESVDELISMLFLNKEEFKTLDSFGNDTRKKQWLSYRALIRNLVKADYIYRIYYDNNNKPFLVNPQRTISVSHCANFAAVLISKNMEIEYGLDIEPIHPKILKVVNKFLNQKEIAEWNKCESLSKAVAYWTFKEAIYKAYGKKNTTLRENIHIEPFDFENEVMRGLIRKKRKIITFDLRLRYFSDLIISIAQKSDYQVDE